jgi:hypothetical protein
MDACLIADKQGNQEITHISDGRICKYSFNILLPECKQIPHKHRKDCNVGDDQDEAGILKSADGKEKPQQQSHDCAL